MATDFSFLWMFLAAAAAVTAIALYEWWYKREERPTPIHDYYAEGLNLIIEGRFREAARALTEAIHLNTDNADAYLRLGSVFRSLGKPRRAAQIHLELSIRSDLPPTKLAQVYRELAIDLEMIQSYEKALKHLDQSRRFDPSCPDDLPIRLRILEQLGRWKEAGEVQKKLSQLTGQGNPVKAALYKIEEGLALCADKKEHDGRILFKDALRLDPNACEAKLCIAASYIREQRHDDAFVWLTTFVKEYPERAQDAFNLLEDLLFDLGRFSEVETILKEAAEKAPRNIYLALALIDLAEKKGELEEALDVCERGIEASRGELTLQMKRLAIQKRLNRVGDVERGLSEIVDRISPLEHGYYCKECGFHSRKLRTRCPECGEFRSFSIERRQLHGAA